MEEEEGEPGTRKGRASSAQRRRLADAGYLIWQPRGQIRPN